MDIMKIFTILLIITIVILIFNLIKVDTNKNIEGFYKYNDTCEMINEKAKCITDTKNSSTCKWIDSYCDSKINCYDINEPEDCIEASLFSSQLQYLP
jgi:hypothetical protein